MFLKKTSYSDLNAKQKENYNFQKIAAELAEYGFSCLWLNDDWQGADFIANHIDGETFIRVQLKGRLTVDEKYKGKNIYVAFRHKDRSYLYSHDEFLEKVLPKIKHTESWLNHRGYSWNNPLPRSLSTLMEKYSL